MTEKHVGAEFPPEGSLKNPPPYPPQGGPSQTMGGEQPIYVVQTPQDMYQNQQTSQDMYQIQSMDNRGLPPLPQVHQQTPQSPPPGYVQPQQPMYEQVQYTQPGVTYMPYQP